MAWWLRGGWSRDVVTRAQRLDRRCLGGGLLGHGVYWLTVSGMPVTEHRAEAKRGSMGGLLWPLSLPFTPG